MTEFRKVPLATGVSLNVALAGPADAPPVILLHGFPESHRTWRGVSPLLDDGFRLIMRVRQEGLLMPAVALTGYARSVDRMKALAAGFQAHLAKPAEPADLVALVARLGRRNVVAG